jgi:hypothetical protein
MVNARFPPPAPGGFEKDDGTAPPRTPRQSKIYTESNSRAADMLFCAEGR